MKGSGIAELDDEGGIVVTISPKPGAVLNVTDDDRAKLRATMARAAQLEDVPASFTETANADGSVTFRLAAQPDDGSAR